MFIEIDVTSWMKTFNENWADRVTTVDLPACPKNVGDGFVSITIWEYTFTPFDMSEVHLWTATSESNIYLILA